MPFVPLPFPSGRRPAGVRSARTWLVMVCALVVSIGQLIGVSPAVASPANPDDSALMRAKPSWCTSDLSGAANPINIPGSRFEACRVVAVRWGMEAVDDPNTDPLELRALTWVRTKANSPVLTVSVMIDVVGGPDRTKPVVIKALKPTCTPSCTVSADFSSQAAVTLTAPFTGMARYDFTATSQVASGAALATAITLPIQHNLTYSTDFGPLLPEWSNALSIPAPVVRCDRAVPGASAGCVEEEFTPTWAMDWQSGNFGQIAAHIKAAQAVLRAGQVGSRPLHRVDSTTAAQNRIQSCKGVKAVSNTYSESEAVAYPHGTSCDEYPFASTFEGATTAGAAIGTPLADSDYRVVAKIPLLDASSKVSIAQVYNAQNSRHGSALQSFYLANRIMPGPADQTGDAFYVGFATTPPAFSSPTQQPADSRCAVSAAGASDAAARAVDVACTQASTTMYTWGGGHGASPGKTYGFYDGVDRASLNDGSVLGFDCSGFVRWAWWRATGQDFLNGTSQTQRNKLASSPTVATKVSRAELRPGDVIFFGGVGSVHHVALYLGDYKIVEARQSGTAIGVNALSSHSDYYEAYRPLVSGTAVADTAAASGNAYVWATNVNVRSAATTTSTLVRSFSGAALVAATCQAKGQSVTYGTGTSEWWLKVPDLGGWISNVFVRGGEVIAGIPACSGSALPSTSGRFQIWASNVNVRSAASPTATKVATIASPTNVDIVCQMLGTPVTDGGASSSWWSRLSSPAGYISNVYVKGAERLDGVPECAGSAPVSGSGYFRVWATNVNVRTDAASSSALTGTVSGPSTVTVQCQKLGQTITDSGYTSAYWSKLAAPAGFVSNVYLSGPAQLPGVPLC